MAVREAVMGRPKRKLTGKSEPNFKTIGVRTSQEWADWLDGLARHYRTTVAGVIDRALAEWSEAEGYPVRPPERIP
jgi:hypothetical protein